MIEQKVLVIICIMIMTISLVLKIVLHIKTKGESCYRQFLLSVTMILMFGLARISYFGQLSGYVDGEERQDIYQTYYSTEKDGMYVEFKDGTGIKVDNILYGDTIKYIQDAKVIKETIFNIKVFDYGNVLVTTRDGKRPEDRERELEEEKRQQEEEEAKRLTENGKYNKTFLKDNLNLDDESAHKAAKHLDKIEFNKIDSMKECKTTSAGYYLTLVDEYTDEFETAISVNGYVAYLKDSNGNYLIEPADTSDEETETSDTSEEATDEENETDL